MCQQQGSWWHLTNLRNFVNERKKIVGKWKRKCYQHRFVVKTPILKSFSKPSFLLKLGAWCHDTSYTSFTAALADAKVKWCWVKRGQNSQTINKKYNFKKICNTLLIQNLMHWICIVIHNELVCNIWRKSIRRKWIENRLQDLTRHPDNRIS